MSRDHPAEKARLWGVVPAAGIGRRFGGDCPKQYQPLHDGRSLLEASIRALLSDGRLAGVMVALAADDSRWQSQPVAAEERVAACQGGSERALSVQAALEALQRAGADGNDWVLVHDAARPGLAPAAVTRLIDHCQSRGEGGILALPLRDTLKRDDGNGRVGQTLPRAGLWQAQTPQMFPLAELHAALTACREAGYLPTDEAEAMERHGRPVHLVPGTLANLKITTPEDLAVVNACLRIAGSS